MQIDRLSYQNAIHFFSYLKNQEIVFYIPRLACLQLCMHASEANHAEIHRLFSFHQNRTFFIHSTFRILFIYLILILAYVQNLGYNKEGSIYLSFFAQDASISSVWVQPNFPFGKTIISLTQEYVTFKKIVVKEQCVEMHKMKILIIIRQMKVGKIVEF